MIEFSAKFVHWVKLRKKTFKKLDFSVVFCFAGDSEEAPSYACNEIVSG